MKAYNT